MFIYVYYIYSSKKYQSVQQRNNLNIRGISEEDMKCIFQKVTLKRIYLINKSIMDLRSVYNKIGNEFSATRYRTWPCVDKFFDEYILPTDYILDAGCGNGKNMTFPNVFEACDITDKFLQISSSRQNAGLTQCNVVNLPYRENEFDAVICVAVIHHLSTEELRQQAIIELLRCVKPGGHVLITNWAYENNKFAEQDTLIPFKNNKGEILANRYYHLFVENELPNIIHKIDNGKLMEYYNDHNNWIGIVQKQY